jgi:hypothetical protein
MIRIIYATVIIVGVISTWFYLSFESSDKLIMKCADQNYTEQSKTLDKGKLMVLFGTSIKKRFKNLSTYKSFYQACEMQYNNSPKTFKRMY